MLTHYHLGEMYRQFIRGIHALPARPFPTATQLKPLDAMEVIAACTASALPLSSNTQELLKTKQIDGKDLLCMSAQHLVALGMKPGDAGELMEAVDFARFGGPKTVHLILGAGRESRTCTFDNPQHLESFLTRQGAAGLCDRNFMITSDFRDLRQDEVYTVDFVERGDIRWVLAKASRDTGSKVAFEKAKRAVVEASLSVFGEALTADVRNDIPLKLDGEPYGNVDSLLKGPTLHLLLGRHWRLVDVGGIIDLVISRINLTRSAYSLVGQDVVDGRKCRVKSMVYAEAVDAQAQQELLKAGIYVLSGKTMAILSP